MSVLELVCASANPDKQAEIQAVLDGLAVLLPRPQGLADVVEDADDLEGNARLKAVAVARAAGGPAVADDTGLHVDALDGAPGVRSARFAGPDASYDDNVAALLAALDGVESSDRTARFQTVALVAWPDGREVVAVGEVEGLVLEEPRGDGGFGYDSVFRPLDGDGRSFAEMSSGEKNSISHRGRAFRALAEALGSRA